MNTDTRRFECQPSRDKYHHRQQQAVSQAMWAIKQNHLFIIIDLRKLLLWRVKTKNIWNVIVNQALYDNLFYHGWGDI